ncbi:MAG: hypothetical protein ABEJ36_05800 [Candidatus Nanosalina sp.]
MPGIKFSELPENLRVKLSEQGQHELWHRVEEFGGVKNLAEAFDYSRSKIYNWKSKDLALPLDFVRQIMGENNTDEVILLKGPGSSGKIEDPEFPLRISDELLTRAEISVRENSEGTPIYITPERSLADRFAELLEKLGEVDYEIYSRDSRFELRYPKFLHEIFSLRDFDESLLAKVDEVGEINDGKIVLPGGRRVPIEEFEEEVFSRRKRFELALHSGDSAEIRKLVEEESEKVNRLLQD